MAENPMVNKHSKSFFYLIKSWLILSILICLSCQHCQLKSSKEHNHKNVLAYAKEHLPKSGTLIQNEDGYAYIKVSDDYINKLFDLLLSEPGLKKPPYFRRKDAPGAHISVVYKGEHVRLKEEGNIYSFTIKDIKEVSNKDSSFVVITVDAPALETLRKSYGLSPLLQGHEFHITIAKKYLNVDKPRGPLPPS